MPLHGFIHFNKARLLARQVSRFVAVSEDASKRWTETGVDAGKITVVHNGVDPVAYPFGGDSERDRARQELGVPPGAFVALYYGRLDAEKGLDVLLEAWKLLALPPESATLLIVGDAVIDPDPAGSKRRLRNLAPAGCKWLPLRRDVVTPLHAADVVVLPSYYEGFSLMVLEAMATGRPVVATRVGGTPEALSKPFDLFLFEPGDAAGLARILSGLTDWRRADPGLGERCRRRVTENFTLEQMAAGVERVLVEAARSSRKDRSSQLYSKVPEAPGDRSQ